MKTYLIKGFSTPSWHPSAILNVFIKVTRRHSKLLDSYYVSYARKEMTLDLILKFYERIDLNINRSVGFALWRMDQTTNQKKQSVIYVPNNGEFSMVFREDFLDSADKYLSDWIRDIPVTNVICSLMDYAISFQDYWFNPPNSNLFQGLGLSNRRNGYIEGVSAEMWFGDTFWQHAKCTKEDVLKQDWLHCEQRPTHLYVRAWPEPFSSAEGEQGEIQRRLLDLLFGINGDTPPPLPAPQQSVFSQKVLVDGNNIRDLGMDEVRPDGRRVSLPPAEPPPAP
jgi:hypothetical protein